MRRLVLLVAVASCSKPPAPLPEPCPEGMRRAADAAFCELVPPDCAAGSAELGAGGGCVAVGWTSCPASFTAAASGWGCEPVLPPGPCAAGTMPVLGATACQPVGWTSCGAGFAADPSGWGCAPVLPAAPCGGATFEVLGQTTCQPLGDCNAAFPPAAATLFVDDSYTAGQLDASHFDSIGAALTAAPAGATIAVEAGSYPAGLAFVRAVKLIGRCAAQVSIAGPATGPGLDVSGVKGVEVEGVSVAGFDLGAYVDGAGSLELRRSRLEGNLRTGVQAMGSGTVARLVGSVVRGTLADSTGRFGHGAAAASGARLELVGSALVENTEMGVFVTDANTVAQLSGVLVRGTRARVSNGRYGWGLAAQGAARLEVSASAVLGNRGSGVVVGDASQAVFTQTLIAATAAGFDSAGVAQAANVSVMPGGSFELTQGGLIDSANGLNARSSAGATAQVTLTDTLVRGGPSTERSDGMYAEAGSVLEATRTAFIDVAGGGLHVYNASAATLVDVLVQGTRTTSEVPSGYGLAISQSTVSATRLALIDNAGAAVHLSHGGSGTFLRTLFSSTRAAPVGDGPDFGAGLSVDTQAQADLSDCLVADNLGVGLLATGAGTSARARGTLVRGTRLDSAGDGQGIVAQEGALVLLENVGLLGNRTAALQASDSGTLLKGFNVLVRGTLPGVAADRGRGLNAQGGARVELSDSALIENRQVGIFAWATNTRVVVTRSLIDGTLADPDGRFGNGIEVLGEARLDLRGSSVRGSAGIGLVVAGSSATVLDGKIEANAVGIQAQEGSELKEVEVILEPVGVTEVLLTPSTAFVDNGTRFGSGTVPLPER